MHVQNHTASWIIDQMRHAFIIFSMLWDVLCGKQQVMEKFTFGLIYRLHMDNTELLIFLLLV